LSPLNCNGTAELAESGGATVRRSPSRSTEAPTARRICVVISTSPTSGTLEIVLGSAPRRAATMCLVTAFFEPWTATSPWSGPLGSINQASDTHQR
jgi:hypothetical protein